MMEIFMKLLTNFLNPADLERMGSCRKITGDFQFFELTMNPCYTCNIPNNSSGSEMYGTAKIIRSDNQSLHIREILIFDIQ